MEVSQELKETMIRYLLGRATSVEQEALEDRFAAEPEVFEQLVAVENDLLDQYARNQLSAQDRSAFERHVIAHPDRRARVQFAQSLVAHLDKLSSESPPPVALTQAASFSERIAQWWRAGHGAWSLAFSFATALLLVAGSWWMWRAMRRPAPIDLAQQPPAMTSPTPPGTFGVSASPETTPTATVKAVPAFVTLTLNAGGIRGNENAEVPTVTVLPETDELHLRVKADVSGYARYRLTLQSADGKALRSQVTSAKSSTLAFTVPANLLAEGEFFIAISGLNPNGEADALSKTLFRVKR